MMSPSVGFVLLTSFLRVTLLATVYCSKPKQPHIVFMLADDLGWNDVGFNNPDMLTPNIDKLANDGILLDQAYVQPMCSPSRAALMTGMFPYKIGLQHVVIINSAPVCAPSNYTFLSEELEALGYSTHMVGKWHLGFCNLNCTPTYRGFQSFFGFYGGFEDFFNHKFAERGSPEAFLDYRNNTDVADQYDGKYATETFNEKAVDIIEKHDPEKPLFLYMAYQNPHFPLQTTQEYIDRYPSIQNDGRKTYSGQVSALDDSVGVVVDALKSKGIFNDTILIFMSDNGGNLATNGNNFPLRGGKRTIFEGGTRVPALMHGPGLNRGGQKYDGLIHIVDWKATLVASAGGKLENPGDSMDHWKKIITNKKTKRTEFIYNLDDLDLGQTNGYAALRYGDYKLIHGYAGTYDGHYEPNNSTDDQIITRIQLDDPLSVYMLYNVKDDPNEKNNLVAQEPKLVEKMLKKIEKERKLMIPANFPPLVPASSDPKLFGNVWSPGWC